MQAQNLVFGMLVYPNMTNLDHAGPFEIFAKLPGVAVHLLWKTTDLVRTDAGACALPTIAMRDAPELDLLFVPGGPGQTALMDDREVLSFLAERGARARWVTAVCTGTLILCAAGLLRGYRAATHWMFMDHLPLFGAEPVHERVVKDRNRITGGGVTAGIDFALNIAAIVAGAEVAQRIQLGLEYSPQPPFNCGSPKTAAPEIVATFRRATAKLAEARWAASERAARRLAGTEGAVDQMQV